jgi:predicted Rossmann fold nucleotide-binding protein DprA/Smf involved in DNA uptake
MSTSQLEINNSVSANTQAILLLTAPLMVGRGPGSKEMLTSGEYGKVSRFLNEIQRQPADLIAANTNELTDQLGKILNGDRLKSLLSRGFLLSEAVERWHARGIWIVSKADEGYPPRLKERLGDLAPPILYGCGDTSLLNTGGLAIVGSRQADESVLVYTKGIGELAARAKCTVVSGGARGIDQAAMTGGLAAGGKAVGILADNLERSALNRDHRSYLRDTQLVLVSPYDPSAGFNVGNAMQRNKLIYALADAALVVQSDLGKGGTWAGAIEQLEKLRFVPVYTCANARSDPALEALRGKGALPWPNPTDSEALIEALAVSEKRNDPMESRQLSILFGE